MNASWKTTLCGILAALFVGLSQISELPIVAVKILTLLGALLPGVGLLFARDNNVTSEQVKASKEPGIADKLTIFLLVGFLAVGVSGCAWFNPSDIKPAPVAVGNDAALVNAERVHASSLTVYRELIEWEMLNRAVLPKEVSRAVDKSRREFPNAWREASRVLKDYRVNRGDNEAVNRIAAALAAAQSSMLRLKVDASKSDDLFSSLNLLSQSIATLKSK